VFPLAFKETRCAQIDIGSYPISAWAIYTTSKIKQSPVELACLFLLLWFFCFSLILSLLVLFFILHLMKHKLKTSIKNVSESRTG